MHRSVHYTYLLNNASYSILSVMIFAICCACLTRRLASICSRWSAFDCSQWLFQCYSLFRGSPGTVVVPKPASERFHSSPPRSASAPPRAEDGPAELAVLGTRPRAQPLTSYHKPMFLCKIKCTAILVKQDWCCKQYWTVADPGRGRAESRGGALRPCPFQSRLFKLHVRFCPPLPSAHLCRNKSALLIWAS